MKRVTIVEGSPYGIVNLGRETLSGITRRITTTATKLKRTIEFSSWEPKIELKWIIPHINKRLLTSCFREFDGKRAFRIGGISKEEYGNICPALYWVCEGRCMTMLSVLRGTKLSSLHEICIMDCKWGESTDWLLYQLVNRLFQLHDVTSELISWSSGWWLIYISMTDLTRKHEFLLASIISGNQKRMYTTSSTDH